MLRHSLSLSITLKWLHDSLLGPGADELLQLDMANLNSSLEKAGHGELSIYIVETTTIFFFFFKSTIYYMARGGRPW